MKNKKGFTLAEVLVTLAVIGVVAALTIPSLIQNSNTKQAKTSVKKALSTLNQALAMSIAEDGNDAACSNCTQSVGLKELFDDYLSAVTNTDTSITTPDGMIYTFYSSGTACGESVANNDPTVANCIIEVDINADKGSQVAATGTTYSDLYYMILLKERLVPANDTDNNFVPSTATHGFRNTGTDAIGDIALDALIQ